MFPERRSQILVVDDEPNLRRVLSALLGRDGYDVHTAADGGEALKVLHDHHIDLVITDLKMPGLDGMGVLREALRMEPDLPIVMITAHGTVDNAVEALKTGAFDYITKPFDQAEVRAIVRKALDTRRLASDDVQLHATPVTDFGMVGQSALVSGAKERLTRASDARDPLLIVGESGTGKEIAARSVHARSSRRDKPFVKVNCAALSEDAIDRELFGYFHETSGKPGRLELANGGTLFLDEIEAIPATVQKLLLQTLKQGEFHRPGGVGKIPLDARIIAASRRGAPALLEQGFDADLLGEFGRHLVVLPPLRERADDVPALCSAITARLNARFGKQVATISDEAMTRLQGHSWPGNIRELESALEQAVLLCEGDSILPSDLPPTLAPGQPQDDVAAVVEDQGLRAQVKAITSRVERQLIQKALQQTQSNVTHAARLLKISRKGLQLKMKELGLREKDE